MRTPHWRHVNRAVRSIAQAAASLKIGPESTQSGCVLARRWRAVMVLRVRCVVLCLLIAAAGTAPASAQRTVAARGHWAAIDYGRHCEAGSLALRRAADARQQGRVGFRFDRKGIHFYARLSRIPREGSTIVVTVGERPFLLATRSGWAWSRNSQQAAAIMDAARMARGMRVEGRDPGGRRFVDRYLLDGAPTAIDAAAAACLSGK